MKSIVFIYFIITIIIAIIFIIIFLLHAQGGMRHNIKKAVLKKESGRKITEKRKIKTISFQPHNVLELMRLAVRKKTGLSRVRIQTLAITKKRYGELISQVTNANKRSLEIKYCNV